MLYREEEEVAVEVMAEVIVTELNEMVPDADQNQVMVADSVEEGILPSDAQHWAKSAEMLTEKSL